MGRTDTLQPGIWLDHMAFAKATLLPDSDLPWMDAPAFAQWQAKALGLLGKHVVLIPLAGGITAWLRHHPEAIQELRQAKGPLGMTRMLCAHAGFTQWLQDLILNLKTTLPSGQAAVVIPGPAAWMALLLTEVQGVTAPSIDPEDAEDAAVYLANALRRIPADALDRLLIDVRVAQGDSLAGLDTLQKVATHYQWRLGVQAHARDSLDGRPLAFAIVDRLTHEPKTGAHGACVGAMVELKLAAAAMACNAEAHMDFIVVRLPHDLAPELVLGELRAFTKTA